MGTLFFVILAVAAIFAIVRNLGRDDQNFPPQSFGNSPYGNPDVYPPQDGQHFPPQIHIHNSGGYPMGGGYGGYGGGGYYPQRRGGWSTLLIILAFGGGLIFFLSKSGKLDNPKDVGSDPRENSTPQSAPRPTNPELNKIFTPQRGEAPTPRFTSLNNDGSPVVAANHWGVNIGEFASETAANGAAQRVSDLTRLPQQMFLVTTATSVMLRMDCRNAAQAEAARGILLEYRSQLQAYCPDEPEVISW